MKTKTINLYSFSELSEDAKKKAIDRLIDINVTHEWWDATYEDAERIGLKLTEFDLDRNRYAKGKLQVSVMECTDLILKEHGEKCDTYKLAIQFQKDWKDLVAEHSDGIDLDVAVEREGIFDQRTDEMEEDFLRSLLEDYSIMLQDEYDYLTSDKAIIETIEANEYTFTKDGKLEN